MAGALGTPPSLASKTTSTTDLLNLPAPKQKLYVGVFAFLDQTGQHKPNPNYSDFSFAVTQGATSMLIDALSDAGSGAWFRVLERNRLPDLLQERQIIRANRIEFPGASGQPVEPLGPLLNAGVVLEGGIIGYDSNVVTGGAGANYLGIGASVQYQKDTVSIYIRAVSVLTGEILTSVTAEKTIYSVNTDASLFAFVGFNKLLQVEGGVSANEPVSLCVKQAVELGVYATIMEGALKGYWSFADPDKQKQLLDDYQKTRGGFAPASTSAAVANQ
jgi:curli production assembly/transport component CsgG